MNALNQHYPHLDPQWHDAFMLELSARGASGRRVGELLAEVETHCAESGEAAHDAFGAPEAFARSWPLSDEEERRATLAGLARIAAPSFAGLMALLLTGPLVLAWRTGDPVEISSGILLVFLAIGAVVLVFVRLGAWLVRRRAALVIGAWVVGAAMFWLGTFIGPSLHLPLLLAAALVVVGLTVSVVAGRPDTEPLTDPLHGQPYPKTTRVFTALAPWIFVIGCVAIGVLSSVLPLPPN